MRHRIGLCLAALLCALLLPCAASAANQAPEMVLNVALLPDGAARITQTWTTDTDEGTEFYLACRDNGYLRITDFSVSDQTGPYTLVEDWSVDAAFDEKAYRCGILPTDEGVELCWGISEYGENCYTLQYTVHGLVGSYLDADGFNFRFVDEMSLFPSEVTLVLYCQDGTPLTEEVCGVWAFGFEGQAEFFDDGAIYAWTQEPLEGSEHLTLLLELEKGLLSPQHTVEERFEEVKERAFSGSDYDSELPFGDIWIMLGVILGSVAAIVLIVLLITKIRKCRLNRRMKRTAYFRDAPNGGNLNVTHRLGRCSSLCKEDTLLGAYLLRLISQGCLECADILAGRDAVCLRLCRAPEDTAGDAAALYEILQAAAGADGILQPHELTQFCERDDSALMDFLQACERDGMQTLIRARCLKGARLDGIGDLTDAGQRQLDEVLGLKRFLLDFSLIQERGIEQTVIWQDYMVYALLLGIAEQLAPQLRALYPELRAQLTQYERCFRSSHYYSGLMYTAYRREQQRLQAARSAGSGGHASFGGGGGFSGGGGGGTR